MAVGNHRGLSAEIGYYALVLFSIFVALYFAYVGFILIQLWYYKGELEPKPKKTLDLSPHVKDNFYQKEVVYANNRPILGNPKDKAGPSRWTRRNRPLNLNKEEEECSDEEERKALKEERRISRMSAFLQDDCGDGRQFPNIPQIDPKSYDPTKTLIPYALPRFRPMPPSYMQMGLKKMDTENWLIFNHTYEKFYSARAELLKTKHNEVIQVTDEAEVACVELMEEVVGFIIQRYPHMFQLCGDLSSGRVVRNKKTGEEFSMRKPWDVHPLEVCARLAMEDFSILKKSDFSGEYYLAASATLFPAGWKLRERIGKSVIELHDLVPMWKDIPDVLSYFSRLNTNSKACMERHTFFVQINPDNRPLHQLLYIQEGKDFFPGDLSNLFPDNIIVRRERQTFRQLPQSDTIVFTVKTSVERLVDIPKLERPNLVAEIKAWPDEIATFKGRDLWQRALIEFCEKKPTLAHSSDDSLDNKEMSSMARA